MKKLRKISKEYYLRQIMVYWLVFYMLFGIPVRVAMAIDNRLPQDPTVTNGSVGQFDNSIANQLHIRDVVDETIINWGTFDIGISALTEFHQLGVDPAVLNRVTGGGPASEIFGTLIANGRVFIINPAGIVFGSGAHINVSQLVASSLNLGDDDFLDGAPYQFTDGLAAGDVTFNAHYDNVIAERLYLIGKYVRNKGGLVASDYVVMAAGDSVLISENGSSVAVEVAMPSTPDGWTTGDFKVENKDKSHDGVETKLEAPHIILAAGDLWSQAIENVETVKIDVKGPIEAGDLDDIDAYAGPGSDAVAGVVITSGGSVTIDDDITATAVGDGAGGFNASATIDISSGGDLTVKSKNSSGTELIAEATDGVNNNAEISLEAAGAFTINAPDRVTVQAEADAGEAASLLNQAKINITAGSVLITATDLGVTDRPATVSAYAHDAVENQAGVDIQATEGDVEIIGAGKRDEAIIKAEAHSGSVNNAEIAINAAGNVDIIAEKADAQILAYAHEGQDNTANVEITAGGDVHIKSEGGDKHEWYEWEKEWHDGYWSPEWIPGHWEGSWWNRHWVPGHYEDVWHEGYWEWNKVWYSSFTPYVVSVEAIAENALSSNTAGVDITAGGDVVVLSKDGGQAIVEAYAGNALDSQNTANINLTAQDGYVIVHAIGGEYSTEEGFTRSEASVEATAEYAGEGEGEDTSTNTANITIVATDVVDEEEEDGFGDGDVGVIAVNGGKAEVEAIAKDGDKNSAGVNVTADSDVEVLAECEGQSSEAEIMALAKDAYTGSNTAGVDIAASGDVKVIAEEGGDAEIEAIAKYGLDNTATIAIDVVGGDVLVLGTEGGEAAITAFAKDATSPRTNTANVTITATEVEFLVSGGETVSTDDDVYDTEGGDVKVIADKGGEAEIEALAIDGVTNVADVLICIDGGVTVKGDRGGEAEIEALAKGWDSTNTATVGIGAKGDDGIEVIADRGGEAGISSKAKEGETNTASTIVCTGGGVDVKALRGGDAEILAQAKTGLYNDAYVGIGAMGDVVVQTGEMMPDMVEGCDAVIRAEADMGDIQIQQDPEEEPLITTADAEVVVFSHEGNVEVLAYNHGHSGIEAEAQGAHLNTAKVGVAAAADLSPADVALPPDGGEVVLFTFDGFDDLPLSGNVIVEAFGDSEAQILAWAHDAYPIYVEVPVDGETQIVPVPGENTADTVICAPGEVRVSADQGSEARIKSRAGGWRGDEESINQATTQVYATDVKVNVSSLHHGQGIWAYAVGNEENPHVPAYYCMTIDGEVAVTDGTAVLLVQDYANRKDCPTCPPCPCEEEAAPLLAPVAPLVQFEIPRVEGCPALTLAAAAELGIAGETLQVGIGNALALNPSIQPCQACEALVNAAGILRDEDGSRMAAMVQMFNALAPADAPFTPEMATSIAMAFEGAEEGTQYASAMEYIDAFVQYVAVLDIDLGSPVGDSVAFVMDKYGADITGSDNSNIAAFVAIRLEAASK